MINGNLSGDSISFVAYVRGCNNWHALKALQTYYGLMDAKEQDREEMRRRIELQKHEERRRKERKQAFYMALLGEIERLRCLAVIYSTAIEKTVFEPFSESFVYCVGELQKVNYNVEYDPAADCSEWKNFLLEIMQGDTEKITYLQKIAGLSLTGNTEQETCFILYGSTTRNGKSTLCETLLYLLGDYGLTMKPETLAIKQNLDSRQASGDIARLAGCRFCNASEPPKRMLFDTALLKSLLGRDSITARHLHQREFSFIPKFKLVINTNFLPTIVDDTVFSSGRINVISFDRHFEPHEQDKHLKEKLRSSSELSGILNWCIEGLRLYRKQGLEPPDKVKEATSTYRADSDKVGSFINECLTKTGRNSKAKDVYDAYSTWCDDNGYGCENKGNFFSELKNKGLFATSGTVDGKTVKNIVKAYTIETDFEEITSSNKTPFD